MPQEVDVLKISNDDAAFILGKSGRTKEKIARVSGAELDLFEQSLTLEIRGSEAERRRAKKYVECVMAQRVGPVTIDDDSEDDDLTVIQVPTEAVGFVTGSQGNFLRQVEEEWGTLMFFADFRGRGSGREGQTEKLAIFGPRRGRRGAQLKVMAAVETKVPNYFTGDSKPDEDDDQDEWGTKTLVLKPDELSYALGKKGMTRKKLAKSSGCIVECAAPPILKRVRTNGAVMKKEMMLMTAAGLAVLEAGSSYLVAHDTADEAAKVMSAVETKRPGYFTREIQKHTSEAEGFASDTFPMDESELSYALGKDGTTRRKLARASGCIMEYVGQVAFICGTMEERVRARTYLKWLLKQRHGSVYVDDLKDRDDVTVVPVPRDAIGYVTGNRGQSLRMVEEESGTFCFVEGGRGESEQLLIFGSVRADREVAERLINNLVNEKMREDNDRRRYDDRDYGRGGDRYDDRRRDDSRDRYGDRGDRRREDSRDRDYRRRSPSRDRYRRRDDSRDRDYRRRDDSRGRRDDSRDRYDDRRR
ncbi:hypothetical protein EMIHUDRAFT_108051 [Emiliania huxleyi CCMP1516]|uniref:K Homology domain-containing protein n=2 Tax=Emiliania huxleyi TaxID=2903 RepID=A0A0D3HY54_EMIH1|nr:hypothetical protein EMIHUDRAFT_108051 [Emiliania huxleyi CCMP1516]EOD03939.1 hypothetical protein EMIHUDRAFT_108051 [Emiliania huxleyi CCMP1516]|eukprot:XP_005756368.1 hypothetical protein EMIHUDRAFT_108051 [Emiliania huxleyi CCMP1516]